MTSAIVALGCKVEAQFIFELACSSQGIAVTAVPAGTQLDLEARSQLDLTESRGLHHLQQLARRSDFTVDMLWDRTLTHPDCAQPDCTAAVSLKSHATTHASTSLNVAQAMHFPSAAAINSRAPQTQGVNIALPVACPDTCLSGARP
ncbi:hypothetical protein WJX72_012483 [[Myrmecia] bisecta]|uniref:Uncharacterized protein n=1 Tax=[Myrmecia] bisecta TaxID=41462 RepID=A0AAW1PY42_9CHLO